MWVCLFMCVYGSMCVYVFVCMCVGGMVYVYFLKPFCKKEKLYPEQVRYGGPKTNPKFRVFIDQMEFSDLSYLKELEILMHFKKKFTLLAAQEAEKSTKTFSVDWVEPAIIAFNSNILSIIFAMFCCIVLYCCCMVRWF